MARVSITKTWTDGEQLRVAVEVESSYPDAVAEARSNAQVAYKQALADTTAAWAPDEVEED